MQAQPVLDGDRSAYYRASLRCLRFCEAREARSRRFGGEADSVWKEFCGEMATIDRIDLLLRDADLQWPRAFAPRVVFRLVGLSGDEPFGPQWEGLPSVLGEQIWTEVAGAAPAGDLPTLLVSLAAAWEQRLVPVEVPVFTPTSRLVVAGPSAMAQVISAFGRGQDLSWAEQVLVVAEKPFARHLAAMAAALLRASGPTRLVAPDERPAQPFPGGRLVVSDDDPPAAAWARHLCEER